MHYLLVKMYHTISLVNYVYETLNIVHTQGLKYSRFCSPHKTRLHTVIHTSKFMQLLCPVVQCGCETGGAIGEVGLSTDNMQAVNVRVATITSHGWLAQNSPCARNILTNILATSCNINNKLLTQNLGYQ